MGVDIADTCRFLLHIQFTFASCTSLIMYKFKVVSLEREDCGCRNWQNLIGIRGGVGEEAEEKLDSEVEKQTLASIAKEEDTLGRRIGGESRILLGCSALVGICASSVSDYSCRESQNHGLAQRATACIWRLEGNVWGVCSHFCQVSFRTGTLAVRHGSKSLPTEPSCWPCSLLFTVEVFLLACH